MEAPKTQSSKNNRRSFWSGLCLWILVLGTFLMSGFALLVSIAAFQKAEDSSDLALRSARADSVFKLDATIDGEHDLIRFRPSSPKQTLQELTVYMPSEIKVNGKFVYAVTLISEQPAGSEVSLREIMTEVREVLRNCGDVPVIDEPLPPIFGFPFLVQASYLTDGEPYWDNSIYYLHFGVSQFRAHDNVADLTVDKISYGRRIDRSAGWTHPLEVEYQKLIGMDCKKGLNSNARTDKAS